VSIKINKDYFPTPNSRIAVCNGHTSCFLRRSKRIFIQRGIILFFTLQSVWLYNTNPRNVQFSILIFNFCCLLNVSNFVGSPSGRHLYMQYGMCTCIGVSSLVGRNTLSYPLEHTLLPARTQSPTHSNTHSYLLEHTLLPTRTHSLPTRTHSPTHSNTLSHSLEHNLLPIRTHSPTHSNTLFYPLEHTLLPIRTHSPTHSNTISYPLEHTLLLTRTHSPTHSNTLSYPLEHSLLPTRMLTPMHVDLPHCI